MTSVQFGDFSTALEFLRDIKSGVVKRAPNGQGYEWSLDNEELDADQQSFLNAYCGTDGTGTWIDTETGLIWLLETTHYRRFSFGRGKVNFAGHNDWRVPTISELKTLRAPFMDEHKTFVKPALSGRVRGAYSCCTPVLRGSSDDGLVWNFTSNKSSEVQYREGKIKWGSEGGYAGFENDSTSGQGASIYVRGYRTDKLSAWAESLVRWADEIQYHDFPVTTETMLALETLCLTKDKFPEYLSKLENLRSLELVACETTPKGLITLKKLEELNWDNNSFGFHASRNTCELPEELGNLSRLTSLMVNFVEIRTIPLSIGKLLNLKTLHIKYTKIATLPETIGSLESLEELDLTHNRLTEIPATIVGCKSLRYLTIRDGSTQELPNELFSIATLETIALNETSINHLPENLVSLKKLTTLSIRRTKLTVIPEWFTKLNSLQSLDISFNKINRLPVSIGQMGQLEILSFIGTLISELPESLKKLDKLRILSISGTPLRVIPDWIGGMQNLTTINAAKMWCLKQLPQFEGKKINTYNYMLGQPYGQAWLESIGWPGK
jgi:hypothetical protein